MRNDENVEELCENTLKTNLFESLNLFIFKRMSIECSSHPYKSKRIVSTLLGNQQRMLQHRYQM